MLFEVVMCILVVALGVTLLLSVGVAIAMVCEMIRENR